MRKCNIYLNELKDLYMNFYSLNNAPFLFFSEEAVDLLNKIKIDIEDSYVDKSPERFRRYSEIVKRKLNELPYDRNERRNINIKKWFCKYNYTCDNYTIDTILNLDSESGIYSDLSYPINMLQGDLIDEEIFELQNTFLCFCKEKIVEDIINYLNGITQENKDEFSPVIKNKKVSDSLLLNGKKLNLAERFKIINDLFNINKEIQKFNNPDGEKYQLLSYILGCNISNARQILNDNYNGKVRNNDIENYLKSLNK